MLIFVSTAEDGTIDGYRMDRDTGRLASTGRTTAGRLVMPMAVSPDRSRLYAAVRSAPATINTYAIDPESGGLRLLEKTDPLPDNKVYLSTDRRGRFLLTASFAGNNFAIFRLVADGGPGNRPLQTLPTGGKAHCILADRTNRFVYAIDHGQGRILQFGFDADTGRLLPNSPAEIMLDKTVGPRVAALTQDNRYLYVIHQCTGKVAQFAVDPTKGTLELRGETASVPPESGLVPGAMREGAAEANSHGASEDGIARVWASDIQIRPDGRFLYTTERTRSTITVLALDAECGTPSYRTHVQTETQPRGIAIDPTGRWLVASGEKSDRLSVYAIDPVDGNLCLQDRYPVGRGANWIEIVDVGF